MSRPTFTTADEVVLAGRRWLHEEPRAAVVLVHGFTASADDPNVVAMAEALHATGVDVISYDARGHGRSAGASTLGALERHDVAAAVEAARERADTVVLLGASMGAIAALRYAATDPTLAGTVIVSCPAAWRLPRNVHGIAAAFFTRSAPGRLLATRFLKVRIAARWDRAEPPVQLAAKVRAPLAVVHGDADTFIPLRDAYELHARVSAPSRLIVVPDMGHAFQPAALPQIVEAVQWVLASAAVPAA